MEGLHPLLPEEAPEDLEATQLEELLLGIGEVPQHGGQSEESLVERERAINTVAMATSCGTAPLHGTLRGQQKHTPAHLCGAPQKMHPSLFWLRGISSSPVCNPNPPQHYEAAKSWVLPSKPQSGLSLRACGQPLTDTTPSLLPHRH